MNFNHNNANCEKLFITAIQLCMLQLDLKLTKTMLDYFDLLLGIYVMVVMLINHTKSS